MTARHAARIGSTPAESRADGPRVMPPRLGFTLLEVILAMGLSIVLLSALYAVLKLHLTYAQKAPAQVEKTLQARAIVDIIARDIRAVVPRNVVPKSSSSPSTTSTPSSTTTGATGSTGAGGTNGAGTTTPSSSTPSSSTPSSSTPSTTSTPDTSSSSTPDAYTEAYGVIGGTDWLQLYVADAYSGLDDSEVAALSGSVAQSSNVVRVSYALTVLSTRQDSKGRTQRLALTRSEVAAVGAERLDSSSDDSDIRATTTYLSDDIAQVQFQYWDDTTYSWVDSWGVDTPIAPPRAIKILVSLQDPDEYLETQLGLSGGQSTWEPMFQLVVPITTWSPEDSSSSSEGM
jgi:type II secretory pathway pseudopilin PulG